MCVRACTCICMYIYIDFIVDNSEIAWASPVSKLFLSLLYCSMMCCCMVLMSFNLFWFCKALWSVIGCYKMCYINKMNLNLNFIAWTLVVGK